jgi:hypothetical protein
MSAVWRALFATLCFSVCLDAQTRSLAVYHAPMERVDSAAARELRSELHRLLADARIDAVWQQTQQRHSNDVFDSLAVVSFIGDCSVAELPRLTGGATGARVLAETHLDKNSEVLPFLRVNCAEIIRTLRPALDRVSVPMRNVIFGRALGRVIAHEIYHILAQTTEHADGGVAKSCLSPHDLMVEEFSFDRASIERMHPVSLFSNLGN